MGQALRAGSVMQPVVTEYPNGGKFWKLNGQRHRVDGPAIESANGNKKWFYRGLKHRIGGPAVEWADGRKEWWKNGKRHRIDGPAVEWTDGQKEWHLRGGRLTFGEWLDQNHKLTVGEKVMYKLQYG